VAYKDECQKLQKDATVHGCGSVNAQSLHINLVLQVVEAVFNAFFGPVYLQCIHRVFDGRRKDAEKTGIRLVATYSASESLIL